MLLFLPAFSPTLDPPRPEFNESVRLSAARPVLLLPPPSPTFPTAACQLHHPAPPCPPALTSTRQHTPRPRLLAPTVTAYIARRPGTQRVPNVPIEPRCVSRPLGPGNMVEAEGSGSPTTWKFTQYVCLHPFSIPRAACCLCVPPSYLAHKHVASTTQLTRIGASATREMSKT